MIHFPLLLVLYFHSKRLALNLLSQNFVPPNRWISIELATQILIILSLTYRGASSVVTFSVSGAAAIGVSSVVTTGVSSVVTTGVSSVVTTGVSSVVTTSVISATTTNIR